jgi:hypothetical protein
LNIVSAFEALGKIQQTPFHPTERAFKIHVREALVAECTNTMSSAIEALGMSLPTVHLILH